MIINGADRHILSVFIPVSLFLSFLLYKNTSIFALKCIYFNNMLSIVHPSFWISLLALQSRIWQLGKSYLRTYFAKNYFLQRKTENI